MKYIFFSKPIKIIETSYFRLQAKVRQASKQAGRRCPPYSILFKAQYSM
jgi:hypothetical protein